MATNPSSQSTSSSVWPAVLSHTSKASDTLAQSQLSNLAHASTVAGDHPNAITDTKVLESFRQRANELKPEITRSQLHIIEWTRLQPISENVKDNDINAGGQGTVRRMKLDEARLVAVKFPKHPEHFGSLMREILFMTKITSHDNLMRFEGVVMNQELGIYAVVMPLALCDLKEVIERKGPPKTPEDFDLFVRRAIQICQAVQHLHTKTHKSETDSGDKETDGKASPESSRYVHRDIKPANVLVFEDEQYGQKYETLRLADFGLVKSLDASNNTMSGESITGALGSGPYMAPEMWGGGEGGNRGGTFSDVYAIGATLWQMVVGTAPAPVYTSSQSLRNANTPPEPSSKNDRCPPSINNLVYDCLKVLPKERPRLDQVILELQKYRRLNRDAAYKNVDQVCQAFTQLNYVSDEVPDDNVEPVRSVNKQLSRDKLMKAVRNFDDKDDHQASDVEPSESESLAFNKMVNETDDLTPQLVERAVEMSRRLRRKRGLYAEGNLSVTSVVARLLGLDNTVADAFVIRLRLFVDGWGALGRGFLSHHAVVQDMGIIRPVIVCLVQSLLFLGFDVHLLTEHDTDRYISAGLPPLILEHFACGKTVQCDADLSESTGACVVIESASLIPPEVGESNASLLWRGYVGVFVVSSSVAEANKVKYKGLPLDVVDTIMTAAAKAGTG